MNYLYRISQDTNQDWDTWDSAVVCAESYVQARHMHPSGVSAHIPENWHEDDRCVAEHPCFSWAHPSDVEVTWLGGASSEIPIGVICASFNAG